MGGAPFRGLLRQQACKPDSVLSSHPSERPTWTLAGNLQTVRLGLASGGVCLAAASPRRRCALTAPFQPCRATRRAAVGGVFSVALSRGVPRVGVTDHLALRCPDFPRGASLPATAQFAYVKVAGCKGTVIKPTASVRAAEDTDHEHVRRRLHRPAGRR